MKPVGVRFGDETLRRLEEDAPGGKVGPLVREIVERHYAGSAEAATLARMHDRLREQVSGQTDDPEHLLDVLIAAWDEMHREARAARDAPGARPVLMGPTEVAAELLTTTSNLPKFKLPEPLYSPDHPDERYRLSKGRLYDAGEIRALAVELGRRTPDGEPANARSREGR